MQIYPTVVGLYPTGTYAVRNERATAAQKAEDRKRLFEAVQSVGLGAASEVNLPASQWFESRQTQVPSGDKYHASSEGKEPNFR
jgi:gamma-glutamyl:cysteine ligase YbdK (ATP-grasp superfamily)